MLHQSSGWLNYRGSFIADLSMEYIGIESLFPPRPASTAAMVRSAIKVWVQVDAELTERLKYVSCIDRI
jgi:hypothetical protein